MDSLGLFGFRLIWKFRVTAGFLLILFNASAQESVELSIGKPDAIVNLKTKSGIAIPADAFTCVLI